MLDKCPKCGAEIQWEEVDVGVGIMTGNFHCDACGWCMSDEVEEMMNKV